MTPPIVCIVEDPENAEPECDSVFALVRLSVEGGKQEWKLDFQLKINAGMSYLHHPFVTDNHYALLGRLHAWSRSNGTNKHIFMTEEAAKILLPAMSVPVVEYTLATSSS
jgi:hypothetical protein